MRFLWNKTLVKESTNSYLHTGSLKMKKTEITANNLTLVSVNEAGS